MTIVALDADRRPSKPTNGRLRWSASSDGGCHRGGQWTTPSERRRQVRRKKDLPLRYELHTAPREHEDIEKGFFMSDRRRGGRSSSSGDGRSSARLVRFLPRASSPAKWRGSDPSPTARGWSRQAHGTQHLARIHELPHQDVFGTTHGPLFTRKFVGCARLTPPDPTRQPIDPRTRKGVLARRGIVPEPAFPCGSSSSVHVPLVGSVRDRSFRRRMSVFDTHFPIARDTCLPLRWSFQRIRRHVWHLGRAGCQG